MIDEEKLQEYFEESLILLMSTTSDMSEKYASSIFIFFYMNLVLEVPPELLDEQLDRIRKDYNKMFKDAQDTKKYRLEKMKHDENR